MASIVSEVPNTSARSEISQYGPGASATGLSSIALPGAPMDSEPREVTSSSTRRASSSSLRLRRAAGVSREERSPKAADADRGGHRGTSRRQCHQPHHDEQSNWGFHATRSDHSAGLSSRSQGKVAGPARIRTS